MTRRCPGLFFPLLASSIVGAVVAPSRADILINELYYDHPGADTGWEYIELLNNGSYAADLSTYALEFVDGATGRTRLLWEGTPGMLLPVGERFLVGGSAVDGKDAILTGSIENGPDAVRLLFGAGTVDLIGYGETSYCEGEPAPDVPSGISLSRKPDGRDTDHNLSDLAPARPTPGLPNYYTRDLEIMTTEAPLPCEGGPFAAGFLLVNRGLERFTGEVSLSAAAGGAACERMLSADMAPAETLETSLELPFAPHACFTLRAGIESDVDENSRNDTTGVTICSSPGDLVISEIMYRPLEGGSEWIEIENRTGSTISLRDWRLADATATRRLISEDDRFIPPGGFILLVQDSLLFDRDHPLCPAERVKPSGGWPWLNDSNDGERADMITLYEPAGGIVERIEYTDLIGDERGRSIERFSSDVCSSVPGGLWHRCSAPAGSTPGAYNAAIVPGPTRSGRIDITPNPFHPARDGVTRIWGEAAEGETGLLVRLFDLEGIEVARIFGEEGGARAFSCRWDGRADDGNHVQTGIYICVVEFLAPGGGVCRREKRCIALYR